LLAELGIVPNKVLGQNFLIDRNVLGILLNALEPRPDDAVLEIGPGLGVVTEELAGRCRHVVAVEKDERLHAYLGTRLGDRSGLELRCADMQEEDAGRLMATGWAGCRAERGDKVVSNLPYSVGSRILVNLARLGEPPSRIVVTVQEEVGRRLTAREGDGDYGMLSVWLGIMYEPKLVKAVSPNCFWPRPEVRSAIVCMDRREPGLLGKEQREALYGLTKLAFAQRRKQLATTLGSAGSGTGLDSGGVRDLLSSIGASPDARPEALSIDRWCAIARAFTAGASGP